MAANNSYPSFRETVFLWIKVAIYSFGGPASQIAVMHRLIVEEKKWISEKRFLHALNYCMLLPGPEAQQLAIYIGWLLYRIRGGIVAGTIFVAPGLLTILVLSIFYAKYHSTNFVQMFFYGIKAAVVAIVLEALIRIGKKVIKNGVNLFIAIAAFVGLFFFNLPFPIVIFTAALIGFLYGLYFSERFLIADSAEQENDLVANNPHISNRTISKTLLTLVLWATIWLLPVFILVASLGVNHVFSKEAIFFSKTAVVTFGGAYSVLAYVAQQVVQQYGWLTPGEMLDGLGMAETTPGPLIQVVQFIGFLAAFRFATGMNPYLAGLIGSLITTWVTFIPSFLWILVGAPYVEKLRKMQSLNAAFTAITSAVVGVILNLSLWMALNTLFKTVHTVQYLFLRLYVPDWHTFDIGVFIIMLYACCVIFIYKKGLFFVLGTSVVLGFLINLFVKFFI